MNKFLMHSTFAFRRLLQLWLFAPSIRLSLGTWFLWLCRRAVKITFHCTVLVWLGRDLIQQDRTLSPPGPIDNIDITMQTISKKRKFGRYLKSKNGKNDRFTIV
ncbi:hypothetical protein F5887DRAFT_937731, partial [Amanita rubescens]